MPSLNDVLNLGANPVVLAPMSGVTDAPFRRLARRFGVGLVVSEMIAGKAVVQRHYETAKIADVAADEPPAAVQLLGGEPQVMAEAARILEGRGVSMIDINMGCPVKKVVGGFAGSALMREESLAAAIVIAVVKAVTIPVTVKMRSGWDETDRNAPRLARIVEECGAAMVTVHGRTRAQLYGGAADWRLIGEVKAAVQIPVIGNGDVRSADDAAALLQCSGVDGVMIGRGALGRPWMPGQVAHFLKTGVRLPLPQLGVQRDVLLEHFEMSLDRYGVVRGVRGMRKHIGWYVTGLPGAAAFRSLVNTVADPVAVRRLVMDFYAPLQQGEMAA